MERIKKFRRWVWLRRYKKLRKAFINAKAIEFIKWSVHDHDIGYLVEMFKRVPFVHISYFHHGESGRPERYAVRIGHLKIQHLNNRRGNRNRPIDTPFKMYRAIGILYRLKRRGLIK